MVTKQELEQYRSIVAEIEEENEKPLSECNMTFISILKSQKNCIDSFIHSIKDLKLKRIFEYRYIKGKKQPSFQTIALKMGYLDEGTPRKKIKKYLELSENSEIDVL